MVKLVLKAEDRKVTGRKVKLLRAKGVVPANIYGKKIKSHSIEVNSKGFQEAFKKAGETGIITIEVGKDEKPVLVHNVQVHPATGEILHVDFLQVDLKVKVSANIPVELEGESPAEKSSVGTVVLLLQELEVEALPGDLPERFVVDATKLTEVDQVVKVSDLKYDKSQVEVKADPDEIVVKVEEPQKEEVIEVAPLAEEAGSEVTATEEKPAEGTPPAEEAKPEEK
jgi:large subunit ribosomal protein L25